MKKSIQNILLILLINVFVLSIYSMEHEHEVNDYRNHPCIRDCSNTQPMKCVYEWKLQMYTTMSKACFECPFNLTDCYRPHCITANGLKRQILAINKQIPGPAIQVCENDEITVTVNNELRMGESTSIHWHGMLQKGTQYMDGVSSVSQCAIDSHTSFQYRFKAHDSGTHFFHSHSGLQRADGLFGALIVRQNKANENIYASLYDYDLSEHVIVMNDWFKNPIALEFALHVHTDRNHFNYADAILINGRASTTRTNFTQDSKTYQTPKALFRVNSGYRYRFRLIHAGISHCAFQFTVENHELQVIATDGNFIEPTQVETVILYPGERYDVIINANNTQGTYLIKVKGFGNCQNTKTFEYAYLVYNNEELNTAKEVKYEELGVTGKQLNNYEVEINTDPKKFLHHNNLHGSREIGTERLAKIQRKEVDKKFYFGLSFENISNPEFNSEMLYPVEFVKAVSKFYMPQINRISYMMPSAPLLYQFQDTPPRAFCNEQNRHIACPDYDKRLCQCIHMVQLNVNDVVEFVIMHEKDSDVAKNIHTLHPMHMHGYSYAIVGMGQFYNASTLYLQDIRDLDAAGKLPRNLENPVFKDTIPIPRFGYTIIRFVADNPGIWPFHCHFDFHSETGNALLIRVGNEEDLPPSPKGWRKCGSFFLNE